MNLNQWLRGSFGLAFFCSFLCFLCASAHAADTVCARVKIEIKQELTLERQAFDAHMRINNGLTHVGLENVNVNVRFLDKDAKPVLSSSNPQDPNPDIKFFIRLDSMENITDVNGQGTVNPNTTADIHWMIIPAPEASNGVPQGTLYYVGATLTYTLAGENHVTEVTPDYIYVKPMPELNLDYFLPIYVYGDDPFTGEEEEIIPFHLGLRVKNAGQGIARDVKINSAQPKIVENNQGLLVGFKIIGSEVNEEPVTDSLLVNFGDIKPGSSGTARWRMTCDLYGKFVEFKADISHADELGGELTSLITDINTHFLIKDVLVDLPGRDTVKDFLAKEEEQDQVYMVYESEGLDTEATDQSTYSTLTPSGTQYQLTTPATAGFMYVELDDPFQGQRPIQSVIRSDGKQIKLQNAWLSKTRAKNEPWKYRFHLFDVNATGQYLVTFDDTQGNRPPLLVLTTNKTAVNEGEEVVVLAEATDPDGAIPTLAVGALPALAAFHELGPGRAEMRWTPGAGQAGIYSITFTASDSELQTSRTVQLTVLSTPDSDNNGLADEWELRYFGYIGVDPNADPDGDGLTNLEEFLLGTDPLEADRAPNAPLILDPYPETEISVLKPDLTIQNSVDPDNDIVSYIFEIYRDPSMASLLEISSGVTAQSGATTAWSISNDLQDNTWYYWRVRATDNVNYSLWTYGCFFVNTQNDPPGPIQIRSPVDQSQVDQARPVLSVGTALDLDENRLDYTFQLYNELNQLIASGVTQGFSQEGFVFWSVDLDLTDTTRYYWKAVATDEHGLSNETPLVSFLVNTNNHAPQELGIVAPLLNKEINTQTVGLVVSNGMDADNDPLAYYYELDQGSAFNTPQIQRSGPIPQALDQTLWQVSGLKDHTWYYWRVKVSDGLADSQWAESSFFVNQYNEAPGTPIIKNPGHRAWIGTLHPTLELLSAEDPDLDDLSYSFQVYSDEGLTQLVASGTTRAAEDGVVSWQTPQTLQNHQWYYWRGIAVDEHGLVGPGTAVHAFFIYREFNEAPFISLLEPDQDYVSNGKAVRIRWLDSDPDDNARISLYYDTANAGYNGTMMVSGIEEDPNAGADMYYWNAAASGVTDGAYYIYALIDDGAHQAASNYSQGKVTIDALAPLLNADPAGGTYNQEVTVTLSMNKPGTIYYTLDNSTPGSGSSPYTFPILITESRVLKAVGIDAFGNKSEFLEQAYVILENTPPAISGLPETNVDEDAFYAFTPLAFDPDQGDLLTFSVLNKPAWAVFDSNTGSLTGTPGNADVGTTQNIIISVADLSGVTAALAPFDLTVYNLNDPPVISGIPLTSVKINTAYVFTPIAADPDLGDMLTFYIDHKPAWAVFDSNTGSLTGTPGSADIGATTGIVISVADAFGASASLQPFDLTVTGLETVTVNVLTSKNQPLSNVTVYAYLASGAYTGKSALCDAGGAAVFSAADFTPGAYKFRADYLGIKFWSANVDLPETGQVEVPVPVETTEVTLLAAGQPVSGSKIYLFSEAGAYLGQISVTDAQGKSLFELPVGHAFQFRADLLGSQYWSNVVTVTAGTVNYVTIQAGGGRLTVQVEKEDQIPLSGLNVYLFNATGAYLGLHQVTDSTGRAAFDLSAGSYKARIDYLGYQFWSEVIAVNGEITLLVPIPHQAARITLLDQYEDESSPVVGQKVYLFNAAGAYVGQVQTTDASGQVFFHLPNTAYKVRADYLYQQYWSPEFTWQDQTIVIPLAQAEVSVIGAGLPKPNINVYAFNGQGNYLGLNAKTDSEGKVLFELPAGTNKFRADYLGGQFWSAGTMLEADHRTPVSIETGGGNFTFSLFKRAGQPLANVKCYAFTADGAYIGLYNVSDEQGQAGFSLAQGAYKFRIDYLQHQYWSGIYNIPADASGQMEIEHAALELLVLAANEPAVGTKVYLFSDQDIYLGQTLTGDAEGKAVFDLPVGLTFKFRADILGNQYWSEPVTIASGSNNLVLNSGGGLLQIKVGITAGDPLADLKVYLYSDTDKYLGQYQNTDADGKVLFKVSAGAYKARVDYLGQQFFSASAQVAADTEILILIPHQAVVIHIESVYQGVPETLSGVNVYLFSASGTYLGQSRVSDGNGQVAFDLPERPFKVRADYLGKQYWTSEFTWQEQTMDVPMAEAEVSVTGAGLPQKGLRVYCFSGTGTYLGLYKDTDENGLARFRVPEGLYKFRADYQTNQFWSGEQSLAADLVTQVVVSVGGGAFTLKTLQAVDQPLEGVKAYVFNQQDTYIGLFGASNAEGDVFFELADGNYKFRLDHLGYSFWSESVSVPNVLTCTGTIAHQAVQVLVQGLYLGQAEARPNLRVDLYSPDDKYIGKYQMSDGEGRTAFSLPERSYKVKANYLTKTYCSEPFTWQPVAINIPEGMAQVRVRMLNQNLPGIPVYVFSETDVYLGLKAASDAQGLVSLRLAEGAYKFRADYQGHQYWITASIQKDMVNPIEIQTGGGQFVLSVGTGQANLADAKVYAFNEAGAYIGLNAATDIDGRVAFNLADGAYKFRIDYLGYQFWTGIFTIPSTLNETLVIQHQDIKITVLGGYGQEPLAGLNTYLYKPNNSYLGRTQKTDSNGWVAYSLPDQEYQVRADYLGQKYWSDVFKFQDKTLTIPEGLVKLRVTQAANPVPNLNVYLFNDAGTYLGWSAKTDAAGRVEVILPNQAFKFRVDKDGNQYWSAVVQVQTGQVNEVEVVVE